MLLSLRLAFNEPDSQGVFAKRRWADQGRHRDGITALDFDRPV
jgi:hypothetical protein